LAKEKVPEKTNRLVYYYITCLGIGDVRYYGRILPALTAACVYMLLSSGNTYEIAGWDISFRIFHVLLILCNIMMLLLLMLTRKLPEYRGEPAISDFTAILTILFSPYNLYTIWWVLFALILYFALNELKIVKKTKNNLRNEEKFLFFSYFINNIISVNAAIIIHIIYGGYRALPLIGLFFRN
jgi:hypothetical protein